MSDRPHLQIDAEWVEHLTCEPGAVRWVSLPAEWPKLCPLVDPTDCNGEHCDCPLGPPAALAAAITGDEIDVRSDGRVSLGVWVACMPFASDGPRRVVRHCSGEPYRWWVTYADGKTWDTIVDLPLDPDVPAAVRIGEWAVRLRRVR